jgi:hypothetical protein
LQVAGRPAEAGKLNTFAKPQSVRSILSGHSWIIGPSFILASRPASGFVAHHAPIGTSAISPSPFSANDTYL